jgi:hypothetical protein
VASEKATVRATPVYIGFFVLIFFLSLSLWLGVPGTSDEVEV